MTDSNIDGILVPREQAIIANQPIPAQPMNPALEQRQEPARQAEEVKVDHINEPVKEVPAAPVPEPEPEELPIAAETEEKVATDRPIDEYGNPLAKPRMYTEEELQQRIKDRLRGRYAEQPTIQQTQQAAKDFTPDPNSEESWETQLESFVEKTIEKRQQKLNQQAWQQQEQARQAEFEGKFTAGMGKYADFNEVVGKATITDGIMMAARALDNPASFVYAASKLHPQELSRIAQISDPYAQAAEVGRLHERMVKSRNAVSKAAKPLEVPKGDVPQNQYVRPSIDQLIDQHARQKRVR